MKKIAMLILVLTTLAHGGIIDSGSEMVSSDWKISCYSVHHEQGFYIRTHTFYLHILLCYLIK